PVESGARVAVSKRHSDLGVVWIEIGIELKHCQRDLRRSRAIVRLNDRQVVRASFDDEILLRIEVSEVRRNLDVNRLKPIDLPVHRDRFQSESLLAIMLCNATKTTHCLNR